jgi:formylmethanofuran dehydrogenase subunit E
MVPKKLVLPIGFLVGVCLAVLVYYRMTTAPVHVEQPIEFNHYKHNVEMELDCDMCHEYVMDNAVAGLPGYEMCADCHEEDPDHENPRFNEVARIVQVHAETNEPIRWVRMYKTLDHVIFSHERHLSAHVECSECHGVTGTSKKPMAQPLLISMESCMSCHEKRMVSVDCLACHK